MDALLADFNTSTLEHQKDARCTKLNCYKTVDVPKGAFLDAVLSVNGVDPKKARTTPTQVTLRRPRATNAEGKEIVRQRVHERRSVGELYLALELARRGVGVPIVVAFPETVVGTKGTPLTMWSYAIADDWTNGTIAIDQVAEAASKDRFAINRLSDAMLSVARSAAQNGVVLLELRPEHVMLAEDPLTKAYVARIADYDPVSTAVVGLNFESFASASPDDFETPSQLQRCAYFVNVLMLLNGLVLPTDTGVELSSNVASARRKVAVSVGNELNRQYKALQADASQLEGFCKLAFAESESDAREAENKLVATDLSKLADRGDHTKFLEQLVAVFYHSLYLVGEKQRKRDYGVGAGVRGAKALDAVVGALLKLAGVVR
jgi:hypothetical protein